jgi:hypothetical protein
MTELATIIEKIYTWSEDYVLEKTTTSAGNLSEAITHLIVCECDIDNYKSAEYNLLYSIIYKRYENGWK